MQFRDLMKLPYNTGNNIVDLSAICRELPNTPEQVAFQIYSEHGRLPAFQNAYGDVEIDRLKWGLVTLPARAICGTLSSALFQGHIANVMKRAEAFSRDGWTCISNSAEVTAAWERQRTWLVPPVFIQGAIVGKSVERHLIEGHTRCGALCGLVNAGAIAAESKHKIWLGTEGSNSRQ